MNAAVTEKLSALQSGNHPEYPLLIGNAEPSLEADQVPHLSRPILPPELDHRVGLPAAAWVGKAHRLHRAEAQRLPAPPRHLLDRQAALEVRHLVELVPVMLVRLDECIEESLVSRAVERRVEVVVALSLAVAREGIQSALIERIVGDHRRDRIVKRQRR